MKKIAFFLLAFLAELLSAQPLPNGINGSVQTVDGIGLEGVRVMLHHNDLQQYVETNATGQYHINCRNVTLDLSATYCFSYYKPGFEARQEWRLPTDPRPIQLEKRQIGYIQLRDAGKGTFLHGYRVAIQDGTEVVSDNFGFVAIPIPVGFKDDQVIQISVDGYFRYQPEVLKVTKAELRNKIFDIRMKQIPQNYIELKKQLKEAHESHSDNRSMFPERQFINLYDRIEELDLSPKEKQDWAKTREQYKPSYDFLIKITSGQLEKDTVLRKYKYDLFLKKYDKLLQLRNGRAVFNGYDELFELGMQLLQLDISIYHITEDSQVFFKDVQLLQAFLDKENEMLLKHKNEMDPVYFTKRVNQLKKNADQLMEKTKNF